MANTNFTPWLGVNKVDNIQTDYNTDAFTDGEAIIAKRFNAALRMSSLVAAAIVDALNIDSNIGIEQSLATISDAVKTGLAGIKVNEATAADYATSSEHAVSADTADNATTANNANHATSADTANNADIASSADYANSAAHATAADTATVANKIKIGITAYTLSLSGTTLTLTAD